MPVHLLMFMVATLASGQVMAQACDVLTRSSSDAVTPVERHTCYSYGNLPAEAINWSCSNESKDMLNSQKHKVARCADGSVGSCIAPLTQEALANPKATGGEKTGIAQGCTGDYLLLRHPQPRPGAYRLRA